MDSRDQTGHPSGPPEPKKKDGAHHQACDDPSYGFWTYTKDTILKCQLYHEKVNFDILGLHKFNQLNNKRR